MRIDIPKDMVDAGARRQKGAKYRVLTTEAEYQDILQKATAYVIKLKRSVGIGAPVVRDRVVTTKITGIKRKDRPKQSITRRNGRAPLRSLVKRKLMTERSDLKL